MAVCLRFAACEKHENNPPSSLVDATRRARTLTDTPAAPTTDHGERALPCLCGRSCRCRSGLRRAAWTGPAQLATQPLRPCCAGRAALRQWAGGAQQREIPRKMCAAPGALLVGGAQPAGVHPLPPPSADPPHRRPADGWGFSSLGGNALGPQPNALKYQVIGLLHAVAYLRGAAGLWRGRGQGRARRSRLSQGAVFRACTQQA